MNENISPKEKYELEKQAKQKRQSSGKKLPTSKIIWTVIIIGIVGLIIWLVSQPKPEPPALIEGVSELGEAIELQQATHIGTNEEHDPYNSNPPTSGPHYASAPTPGYYKNGLEDEEAVHGLEHGYIWISYTSAVDEETFDKLRAIQRANVGSVMLTPREGNDSPIVLASWGRMLAMDTYDEATINTYIELHKNQSPEPLAR